MFRRNQQHILPTSDNFNPGRTLHYGLQSEDAFPKKTFIQPSQPGTLKELAGSELTEKKLSPELSLGTSPLRLRKGTGTHNMTEILNK